MRDVRAVGYVGGMTRGLFRESVHSSASGEESEDGDPNRSKVSVFSSIHAFHWLREVVQLLDILLMHSIRSNKSGCM